MEKNYKYTLESIDIQCRWLQSKYSRPCDRCIIGISVWWFSTNMFAYRLSVLGVVLSVWINRNYR